MSQPECQQCSRKSQLFLCNNCTTDLREMLQGLAARWLTYLQDSALGQTRLGDAVRHRRGDEQPMRLNLKAADLLSYTRSVLSEWVRDLCETRGVQVPALSATVDMALWLARNVSAIAADEGAGVCYREIKGIVEDIDRVINRPVPDQFCGKCPVVFEGAPCNLALYAPRQSTEVACPRCKTSHNIEQLFENTLMDADDKSFTVKELHKTVLPAVRKYISLRTLQSWVARGRLIPTGYDAEAEPRFLLEDVLKLREAKPQKAMTGAAAHKRRAS